MVATAAAIDDRPSAFRFPRGEGVGVELPERGRPLEIGRGRVVREGSAVAILSFGARLAACLQAADALAARGIAATVADARFAKPLDRALIRALVADHPALITVEEGAIGGFGSHVAQALAEDGVFDRGYRFRSMVLPDHFIQQDSPERMYAAAAMNAEDIESKALELLRVARVGARRA
jgi:1-deoxy-D-xylulose-5-phosphate synthase